MKTVLKYLLAWPGLLLLAILNGAVREFAYKKTLGELPAQQVSTLTLMILVTVAAWAFNRRWKIETARQALAIGFVWLLLTIAFEFLFGHFVTGHSWTMLLQNYNIVEGKLWVVFLIWITIVPYCIFKWNGSRTVRDDHTH